MEVNENSMYRFGKTNQTTVNVNKRSCESKAKYLDTISK